MLAFVLITLLVACALSAASQQLSSRDKAQEIAALFNKHKSAVKEKYGVSKEKYKDVRSEPVVKQNLTDYSGVYEVPELGYVISIQVEPDGRIQASGYEIGAESNQRSRVFKLEQATIVGGLLTASKVYDNGTAEKFEGVFMNRTARTSPTDSGVTTFGLGVVLGTPLERDSLTYEKLFYQRQ